MLQMIFSLLLSFQASARWATPKDVGSVLQEYNLNFEVEKDGSNTMECLQIWRIQTEEGKINSSLREIEYNSVCDKVEVLEAKTMKGKVESPVAASAIAARFGFENFNFVRNRIVFDFS